MPVYVLNHPPLTDRRERITTRLIEESIVFDIIDKFSPEEFNNDELTVDWQIYEKIIIDQIGEYSYHNYSRKLKPASTSLVLKHIYAWLKLITIGDKFALILEDDCEIPYGFSKLLQTITQEFIDSDCEIAMLGGYLDFISPNIIPDKLLHYHEKQKTRCTHAYLIKDSAAEKMFNGVNNINNPIDFKMNEIIQLNDIKVSWLEPGLKQI